MTSKLEGFVEVVMNSQRLSIFGSVEPPAVGVAAIVPAEAIIARAILCAAELALWDPAYARALIDTAADSGTDPVSAGRDRAMEALRDLIDEATQKMNYRSN